MCSDAPQLSWEMNAREIAGTKIPESRICELEASLAYEHALTIRLFRWEKGIGAEMVGPF
jgi:hypothetical protein